MATLLQKYKAYTNGKEVINNVYNYVNNTYGYKKFKSINMVEFWDLPEEEEA